MPNKQSFEIYAKSIGDQTENTNNLWFFSIITRLKRLYQMGHYCKSYAIEVMYWLTVFNEIEDNSS